MPPRDGHHREDPAIRRHSRRIDVGGQAVDDLPAPTGTDLTRWMSVVDRMLRSRD